MPSGMPDLSIIIRWQDEGDSRLDLVAGNCCNAKDILRIHAGRFKVPAASDWANSPEASGPALETPAHS